MAKTLIVLWLTAVVASSQRKSVEETTLKPNSWIIQSPVKRPLPGLSGIGLPPGGVLLMTMDPNATMVDIQQQQQQSSQSTTTIAVSSVSLSDGTTIEPVSATEVSIVSQNPITSADVEEVAVTDTLSISTGGTIAITQESNSPTLELENVTQQSSLVASDETPTTEPAADAVALIPLITQDFLDANSVLEALKVDSESGQTSDESIELTTVAEADVGIDGYFHPEYYTTEKSETTVESHTTVPEDALPGETYLTTQNSLSSEDSTTKESVTSHLFFFNNVTYVSGDALPDKETYLTTENSLSSEDSTIKESATTEISQIFVFLSNNVTYVSGDLLPDDGTYLTTTTELTTGSTDQFKEEENVTVEVATTLTEDSSTEYSISPIPPKGPALLPEVFGDDESDSSHTEKDLTVQTTTEAATENGSSDDGDDDATTEVGLTGDPLGPSVLLGSLTLSGSSAESDETSTDAGSGAVLSTESNDEVNGQSGSGANPDNGSDAPPDVVVADDSGSVDLDVTTVSAILETESPAATLVDHTETEAPQFLVFTTDATPEDPGLAESVTEIENIQLNVKSNPESSNLVASAPATVIKNAGNSRNLLSSEENAKEASADVTKATEEIVETDTKSNDEEARQYSRPYPIRHGMRPARRPRPGFRPSIDRHDQNFRPEYDDYNFNVISRTYEYCYTAWCKFKKTLSRIGLL
jgi:hypothetical protein